MENIEGAIEALESPIAFPDIDIKASFKGAFKEIIEGNCTESLYHNYLEYLAYYDRLKEEEEDLKSGRYSKKRSRHKVCK